jgi:hypothetical protein
MNVNKAVRRVAVAAGVVSGVVVGSGGVAGAGEPVDQACVGESLSALATTQPFPGAFGAGVVGFAQDPNLPPPGWVTAFRPCRPVWSPTRWCRTPATTDPRRGVSPER